MTCRVFVGAIFYVLELFSHTFIHFSLIRAGVSLSHYSRNICVEYDAMMTLYTHDIT
jgi:hypothetical protein